MWGFFHGGLFYSLAAVIFSKGDDGMATWLAKQFTGGENSVISPDLLDTKTAQKLMNAVVDDGKISPAPSLQPTGRYPEGYGHFGTRDRSVIKWYDRFYWSDNSASKAPFYGGNEEMLGVPYPLEQPFLARQTPPFETTEDVGPLTGEYKYCVTFVNENGFEGAPGSLESWYRAITLENHAVLVYSPAWPQEEGLTIAKARVWRTAANGADFYWVGDITKDGGTLYDAMTDTRLLMQENLSTQDNYPPPGFSGTYSNGQTRGGKYLTESGGVFFLAVGSHLYFSVQGNPHAWPTLNFVDIGDTITGITPEFQGVLVFTRGNTYRVTGADNLETVAKMVIPGNHGCISWRSIAHLDNIPVWLSNDGVCAWDGDNVLLLSEKIVDTERLSVLSAVSAKETYYLSTNQGTLAYDRKNGGLFRWLSWKPVYAWYDAERDKLYFQLKENETCHELSSKEKLDWTYLSPRIDGGMSLAQKHFRELATVSTGELHVEFLVEGKRVCQCTLAAGRARIKLPRNAIGRYAEVSLVGDGTLVELAVIF